MKALQTLGLLALATSLCACVSSPSNGVPAYLAEAPVRPAADIELDARRKPFKVLAFSGIKAGDTVVEIEAGRGYYTDLFSAAVGPKGRVHMINPPFFETFIPDEDLEKRLGVDGKRLPNVTLHRDTPFDKLPLPDASADMVTWILGPHEVFFNPPGDYSFGDPQGSWNEIARVLKPGGKVLAIDHMACTGFPSSTAQTLHRIDPAIIKRLASRAGLEITRTSAMLKTVSDDCTLNVFDERVRRQTDRFVLLMEKL
jgi:predicted methyltransferase